MKLKTIEEYVDMPGGWDHPQNKLRRPAYYELYLLDIVTSGYYEVDLNNRFYFIWDER